MRAEIISVSNGTLQGNKFTMVRGDTLEIKLRVLKDDNSPVLQTEYEEEGHTVPNGREPHDTFRFRLTAEFFAALKDGGDLRVLFRTTQSTHQVLINAPDELTVIIDQKSTKYLPAPVALNFDMQITEFIDMKKRRTSTVYQGVLQIDKDYTTLY